MNKYTGALVKLQHMYMVVKQLSFQFALKSRQRVAQLNILW